MKTLSTLLLLLMLPGVLLAQPGGPERRLSPEDRAHLRQQMREQWQRPAALDAPAAERPRRHWQHLAPEDRQRLRDEMRDHRATDHPPGPPRRHRQNGRE